MKTKLPEMLCRWNAAEPLLRDALSAYRDGTITAERTLLVIDTIIGAATRRGQELITMGDILPEEDEHWLDGVWETYERCLRIKYPNDRRFQ